MCLALIIVMDARLAESEEMLVLPQKMCLLKTISGGFDRRKRTSTASPFTVQLMAFTPKFYFYTWVLFIESAIIIPHLGVAKVKVSLCPWKAAATTNTCVHVDTLVQTFDSLWAKRPPGIYMVWELMKLRKGGQSSTSMSLIDCKGPETSIKLDELRSTVSLCAYVLFSTR